MNSYKVISLLSNQERVITGRPWLIITHLRNFNELLSFLQKKFRPKSLVLLYRWYYIIDFI